jgi:hypothetical protein
MQCCGIPVINRCIAVVAIVDNGCVAIVVGVMVVVDNE